MSIQRLGILLFSSSSVYWAPRNYLRPTHWSGSDFRKGGDERQAGSVRSNVGS